MGSSSIPLAARLRPLTLDDFVGQEHVIGPGTPLRAAIEADTLRSIILAGPPGTGKTTLAAIIAKKTAAQFVQLSAVMSGVKDLKQICHEATLRDAPPCLHAEVHGSGTQACHGEGFCDSKIVSNHDERAPQGDTWVSRKKTVLFIDEIHRFNRAQQDALLSSVEQGTVILVGATTENPYFEVNAALVSRSHVYLLQPLSKEHLVKILRNAAQKGFEKPLKIDEKAIKHLATIANGDARIALNALELSVLTGRTHEGVRLKQIEKIFQHSLRYDRAGEDHYNTISAFIKTLRGSDPDAALVWMFKMIASGEEPRFIFRRMLIFASEDIGNADPNALRMVVAAWQAFEMVGLPEGEYFLAHACIYLAQAPKSNAVKKAMDCVKHAIKSAPTLEVPNHLRNAPVKGMEEQGYSVGYRYPHDDKRGVVGGNYFPIGFCPQDFYEPSEHGLEGEVQERLKRVKAIIRKE